MKQRYNLPVLFLFCGAVLLSANALQIPLPSLSSSEMDTFVLGKSFFRTPWVEAPSATTARDGLGPLFSANTCQNCHPGNGKGRVYNKKGELSRSLVTRLSLLGQTQKRKMGFTPEPTYGGQLSINAVHGVPYEGKPTRRCIDKHVALNKHTQITLHKPVYGVTDLQYGPMAENVILSQRVAPALAGLGKLEEISDKQILANEDVEDRNADGISGKANRVYDLQTGKMALGRFNWKANAPSVKQQVASAMHDDMGLTSPLYPNENCTPSQTACLQSPKGKDTFDLPMKRLDAVTFYLTHLKVPQHTIDKEYSEGLQLFKRISCDACHIPGFTLQNKEVITPFSDLLLHDMGEGLADGRVEFDATGSEFRTAPLWGISAYKKILKEEVNYLHDGRAKTIEEAILWHGGEAQRAKENFKKLTPKERQRLIHFLEAL